MALHQRKYDMEHKIQAVKLAREIAGTKAAKELGIPEGTLHTWLKAAKSGTLNIGDGAHTPDSAMSLAKELADAAKEQDKEIRRLMQENEFLEAEVIADANLDRTYGYQIFDGRKNPSRDKLLQLAFGLGLTVEQTQTMLKIAQVQQLYPRVKRDTYILSALFERKSLTDCNCTLAENHLAVLGELK